MDGRVVVIGGMGVFNQREEGLESGVGCGFLLAFFGVVWPLYVKSLWPLLTAALSEALEGRGDRLLALSDQYTKRDSDGYTTNSMAALLAVNCLDHNDYTPIDEVPDRVGAFRKASPTFGRVFAYGLATCQFWPVKSDERTEPLDAAGAPVNGLDPIACLRVTLRIPPGATARVTFAIAADENVEALIPRILDEEHLTLLTLGPINRRNLPRELTKT